MESLPISTTSSSFHTRHRKVFKPKEPQIMANPTGLEKIDYSFTPNMTINLDMIVTIDNKENYGSFKFKNSTAYVNYRGDVVAEIPIGQNIVPAHGKLNITSSTDFMIGKVISNPNFLLDFIDGRLNLTSIAILHGKVNLFNIVKRHATASSYCDISFKIDDKNIQTICKSKINL
ncbi:hypothetical protein F8388_018640 [Cannabis sativa]|uniref:Late embryogenesis abundant protein LEA-2 subgroup domain-containing protein n=1 Tax=Cannabis sativa TaxID=3483 RepID=A0A7J6FCU8_CANSA|nr:hypothetical protein F8388_018640 [Cannabis sativa]